jgi:nucleotide-binding universal stress UspA family protein
MKKISRILYATDFSESSAPAAEYALTLAQLAGADIHVLHVVGELEDKRRGRIPPEAFELFEKEIEVHVIKEMDQFCRQHLGDKVRYTTETAIGKPFQVILATARSQMADLIIVGTHGRTGIEHVLMGSTAERVARRSPIPVMTVPCRDKR